MDIRLRAGERIRAVRELMGITREEFAKNMGLDLVRLRNVEQRKVRASEVEYEVICSVFPEFTHWLTYEGDISLEALEQSENPLCQLALAKVKAGQIPKGYHSLKEKFK